MLKTQHKRFSKKSKVRRGLKRLQMEMEEGSGRGRGELQLGIKKGKERTVSGGSGGGEIFGGLK